MLAFGIRYLTGSVTAAAPDDRNRPEWPPHPARVFMALAAAHFETGADPAEREALCWLETLAERGEAGQPRVIAGGAWPRAICDQFVPVNDEGVAKSGGGLLQGLPIKRRRAARTFARAWLEDDSVALVWPDQPVPPAHARALERLCAKVARIGHAASLVQMWCWGDSPGPKEQRTTAGSGPGAQVLESTSDPDKTPDGPSWFGLGALFALESGVRCWLPDDGSASQRLRVVGPGTLADLERAYNQDAVEAWAALELGLVEANGRPGGPDKRAIRALKADRKARFPDGPPPRLRPRSGRWQGYRPLDAEAFAALEEARAAAREGRDPGVLPGSRFSPHLVVRRLEWREAPWSHLDLADAPLVIRHWREALGAVAGLCGDDADAQAQPQTQPQPQTQTDANPRASAAGSSRGSAGAIAADGETAAAWARAQARLTGMGVDGRPAPGPHVALLPLAFVGHPQADGHLMGLAAALPADLDRATRRAVLAALGRVSSLRLGRLGLWGLDPVLESRPPWTLVPQTLTADPVGARVWASVTPIAFDRHPRPGDRHATETAIVAMVAEAVEAIGLPPPQSVRIGPLSAHPGAPAAGRFPRIARPDGSLRRQTHAILTFATPVVGPVVLGAGRYLGHGLCRPLSGEMSQ